MTARPEEGDELRCKSLEQISEGIFVRRVQKPFRDGALLEEAFICDWRLANQISAPFGCTLHKALARPHLVAGYRLSF